MQSDPNAPKRLHIKNHDATAVWRVHFEPLLEPQAFFKIKSRRKRFWFETVCNVYHLGSHFWFLLRFRNRFWKHYETAARSSNRQSEKQFRVWVGDYNLFRNVHAKTVSMVQTFGVEFAKGRSSRYKPRSGEHMYAKPQREHDIESKTL